MTTASFLNVSPAAPSSARRSRFNLHLYQTQAIDAAVRSAAVHPYTMVGLPTGSGKTPVGLIAGALVAERARGRVLWLAYQGELLEQAAKTLKLLRREGWIPRGVEFDFLTVQAFMNLQIPPHTAVIVVDEAHHLHGSNKSWRDLRSRRKPIIGLTATPRRSLRRDGWNVATYVARDELTPRYLALPIPIRVPTGFTPRHVDVTDNKVGWDFDADTHRALNTPERNRWIARYLARHRGRLAQMLVYVHLNEHCEDLARACRAAGLTAAYVHGGVPRSEREDTFRLFAAGKIDVLVNSKLVSEGVDVPNLASIVMAVPTMSDIRFAQMLGRGCRKTKHKSRFYVVDFVDNLGKFEAVLAGRYLFDGCRRDDSHDRDRRARFDDSYKGINREFFDQPYVAELQKRIMRLRPVIPFAVDPRPEPVERYLLDFAEQNEVDLCWDERRPREVQLVHRFVYPLLAARLDDVIVRKEFACEDGTRCDIFIGGTPSTVIEFSTRREGVEKAEQVLHYAKEFRRERKARKLNPTLVAVSYCGDARSRVVEVAGRTVQFINWRDFMETLGRGGSPTELS